MLPRGTSWACQPEMVVRARPIYPLMVCNGWKADDSSATLSYVPGVANEVTIMDEADGIGRRDLGSAVAISALLMLAGCKAGTASGPSVDSELTALGNAISSLSSTVDRFKAEEWKDVVPDVQSDASGVATAFANLKAAIGKL